jgi:formylglycine-generating enzyme required for sulfatase activity
MKCVSLCVCVFVGASLWMIEAKTDEPSKSPTSTADPMLGKEPGQVRNDNGLQMKFIWCPAGRFRMGSPETETPRKSNEAQVNVILTRGFWIGKFEVTRSEWKQIMATEPWEGKSITEEGDDYPAVWVNQQDAMEFCRKLTNLERMAARLPEGWEFMLPTEAEWERACRAGTKTTFNFGNNRSKLGEYAWFDDTGFSVAGNGHPVGQKKSNHWGLYDMHGNVWEWCRDCYADRLPGGRDPEVTEQDAKRVIRGGCVGFWCHQTEGVDNYRSARRSSLMPSYANQHLGFRVAFSPTRNK